MDFLFVEEPEAVSVSPTHIAVSSGSNGHSRSIHLFSAESHTLLWTVPRALAQPFSMPFTHDGSALVLQSVEGLCLHSVLNGGIVGQLAPFHRDTYMFDVARCPGGWVMLCSPGR